MSTPAPRTENLNNAINRELPFEAATEAPEHEDSTPLYLESFDVVRKTLCEIDWSFTKDNTAFLTHDIHPYPAKFIPQIPGHLINLLSARGDLVVDPFGGSGTTALEAVRLGRRALSIDANPIATLIGQTKTARLDSETDAELLALQASLAIELGNLPTNPSQLLTRLSTFIPKIANRQKWFSDTATAELALIRSQLAQMKSEVGRQVAGLALSRIVLQASFQDSETRYKSVPRAVASGETLRRYLRELDFAIRSLRRAGAATRYGVADFRTGDILSLSDEALPPMSADLVVTSPPYGNANDYHLYHRFRLLWLGFDPIAFGHVEIGSHLRHQREGSGFESYITDLTASLRRIYLALKPGRYAALVIGDSLYEGKTYPAAQILEEQAAALGFDGTCNISRPVHKTKRSFTAAGRRACSENILILRKEAGAVCVRLDPPPYRLFPYEKALRRKEVESVIKVKPITRSKHVHLSPSELTASRRLVFTHQVCLENGPNHPTWQAMLENGFAAEPSGRRKDPKYVTHGIHPYKGKFYPQLAKALLNTAGLREGATILDPFCGSGTTLLEGQLNGLRTRGIDMNPLAATIARAKVGILEMSPDLVTESVEALLTKISKPPESWICADDQFASDCMDEINRWFPGPVIPKLNWLLKTLRTMSSGYISDLFLVLLSSIIREVSQQAPNDLRIRYRNPLLTDADVYGLFSRQLKVQFERLQKFWSVRGYAPCRFYPSIVTEGDSRSWETLERLGIEVGSVDAILTSPPYATALPYIDTDRLSLLTLFAISSQKRRPLEQELIGSREIITSTRKDLEEQIENAGNDLTSDIGNFLTRLQWRLTKLRVGFRRRNMPALLLRFFSDMKAVLINCHRALRPAGEAIIVIGDNRIELAGTYERIPTTDFVATLGVAVGFSLIEQFDISVTTENLVHQKNAITHNRVLRFRRN